MWPWHLTYFLKTFSLAYNFWTVRATCIYSFDISHEYFMRQDLSVGTNIFYPVTLTLKFGLFFENLNLAYNFWTVSSKALISLELAIIEGFVFHKHTLFYLTSRTRTSATDPPPPQPPPPFPLSGSENLHPHSTCLYIQWRCKFLETPVWGYKSFLER